MREPGVRVSTRLYNDEKKKRRERNVFLFRLGEKQTRTQRMFGKIKKKQIPTFKRD